MKRGLVVGLVVGSLVGAYYAMSIDRQGKRRIERMTDDLLDQGSGVVEGVRGRAVRLFDRRS